MFAFLPVLLLCVHLLHFKIISGADLPSVSGGALVPAPVWPNGEINPAPEAGFFKANANANATAEENLGGTVVDASSPNLNRQRRQFFFDPSILLWQGALGAQGVSGGWGPGEGSKCLTSRGQPGVCVRIDGCRQYYRLARQLSIFTLRQWPQANGLGLNGNMCNFFDLLGRVNNGICCTNIDANSFGVFPLPGTTTTTTEKPSVVADEEDREHLIPEGEVEGEYPADAPRPEEPIDNGNSVEDMPDFQDVNTIEANPPETDQKPEAEPPVEPVEQPVPTQPPSTISPYQWPFGSFAGGQWPPALPTHPPTTGGWPPPLPTHPPNHHYPTHPTTGGVPSTKRTTPRPTSPTRPTTTRRPIYPGYPTPVTTTTTTRRPVSGTSPEGLPLQCGNKNPVTPDQERIVGGINAGPHEFPWIAVLFKSGKQFCGGSLITNSHILTAAHCVARMTSWDVAALTANLGDYNIGTDFEVQHVSRRIKRLVRHKGFEFSTLHNDVAVLTLSEPVPFTREIQPICLPTSPSQQSRSYSGQVATVAGWGSLRENGPQPSILQKVDIPIWTNAECARKYGRAAPGGIIESMICAGQAAKDSCSGDSGGPMVINDGGRYTQVGIVSWGIGCGKGQYPGVYTRVTSLLPWIYKNIK
ncbi:transmembrane protease serine 9 [Drosophila santomea]|uniref:transmembrane protease serine 9 n=1 Tax=Drosophila santomea TaxID=129105 RepID=UPI001952A598|nr:transmembrane protease serine 9 [Drosophila santomea]